MIDSKTILTDGWFPDSGVTIGQYVMTGGWFQEVPQVITKYSLNDRRPNRLSVRKSRQLYIRGRLRI